MMDGWDDFHGISTSFMAFYPQKPHGMIVDDGMMDG